MRHYFNNCRCRDYISRFGSDAFYDLNLHGIQDTQAKGLRVGDECVVAAYAANGDVSFSWYAFTHERIMPAKGGPKSERFRVLFGTLLRKETLSKVKAATTTPYSIFFNSKGHFKQQSVIQPDT
jgi:hypothetical protein